SYATTTFGWIDPATHTDAAWTNAASCTGGGAAVDDDITGLINLGFTFNFGGVNYTQVRIMSNGRLQFNNTFCGYGTQSVGPPRTYPYGYPNANVVRTMKVYGADFDPGQGGTVRYASLGTAPNRYFVATWSNVPEWNTTPWTCAQSCFNLQVILYESGEFVYQYGTSANASGGKANIGWELTTADYGLVTFTNIGALANTAYRFYIPAPYAEYRMEQASWNGTANEVVDSSGYNRHGAAVGLAQTTASGKICRGADIPNNTTTGTIAAINSGIDMNSVGAQGGVTFWYRLGEAWNANNRQLFDATTVNNRWFFLTKRGNRQLRFVLTDSANNNIVLAYTASNYAANTWVHIAVTWDMSANRYYMYVNGAQVASSTSGSSGALHSSIDTLYIGDNRSTVTGQNGTGNSANGAIDEFRLYGYAISAAVVTRDYLLTRSCSSLDHIRLEHTGVGLTCTPSTVTVKACADVACATLYSGSATVTLSPASGWTTNPITFTGSTTANLSVTTPSTVTLSTSAVTPMPSGTSPQCFVGATANCNLVFADTGFIFSTIPTQTAGVTSGSLTIQAVKKADNSAACTGVFTGSVVVNLASQCINPTTCNGKQVTINATAIANNPALGAPTYTPVTLNFGASSTATFTLNYPDVGNMSLSARYALGSDFMTGTSNTFGVKPFGFAMTGIQRTSDSFANPAAGSAAGPKFIHAGESFTATVSATAQGGAAAPNYGRETVPEGVLLTPNILLP
ncbi:MAG: LamG-like jellyroll fold domain-containing protein, partial [bacterium]|nr:LamG-like jellyroll fold domain-containing protein [bacterium]